MGFNKSVMLILIMKKPNKRKHMLHAYTNISISIRNSEPYATYRFQFWKRFKVWEALLACRVNSCAYKTFENVNYLAVFTCFRLCVCHIFSHLSDSYFHL